jgi:hypothetical protein
MLACVLKLTSLTVSQLPDADEACPILVEHLESLHVVLGVAGIAEAARSVQNLGKSIEVDFMPAQSAHMVSSRRDDSAIRRFSGAWEAWRSRSVCAENGGCQTHSHLRQPVPNL